MMKRNIKYKIKNHIHVGPTVTHMAKMTRSTHSLIYCRNGTVQLQIQLMEQLQKPIAKDSITVKKLGEVQHRAYLRYLNV